MKRIVLTAILITVFFIKVSAKKQQPNIIVFIADDVSWDDFGCYGNKQVKTPNIDKLAKNGIRFTNAYLTASSSSPSRNSIMTGRYPHNTGAAELHTEPPVDMISFPEVMRKSGYYTVLSGKFHMGEYAKRGFDLMNYSYAEIGDGGENLWLKELQESPKDKPFFMWFAALDAHRPWGGNEFTGAHNPNEIEPPYYLANGIQTKTDLAKYYDEITRFDFYIGEIIKELKQQNRFNNTMIIVMADNGRPFPHSKTRVNDRGMKTPFIIHYPDVIKENRGDCRSLISAVDIAPTILEIAGAKPLKTSQGFSFHKLLQNTNLEFRNYLFAEHNWHDFEAHERMVRSRNYLYILNSRPLLTLEGSRDAVSTPSSIELRELYENGKTTNAQAEILTTPRPVEELYCTENDTLQNMNLSSDSEKQKELLKLRKVLKNWMKRTADNIPEQITKDWYQKIPGGKNNENYKIRGEMPGAKLNATKNNDKGYF